MASSMLTAAAAEVSGSASKEVDVDETLKSALHACANDPDFAIICDFLQKFSNDLGLDLPNFKLLMQWLTRTDEVSPQLREMQIKLLRKTRKTVHEKSWESALSKFCFTYSAHDAWEVERFGYKNASVKVKLRILRELLECQFERNTKFRAKILTLSADSLRSQPIGRDSLGHAYWVTQDNDCNIRIYQEHLDEEIWQVVATNRDEFVNLIKRLRGSEVVLPSADIGVVDEDTSSSSSSRIDTKPEQKPPPPEEEEDSQEDEQKVPKLSIKLLHGKGLKEDVGKGEEELAAEEDAKQQKKSNNPAEANDSGEEEFEEVEEEYEDESESEGETEDEEDEDDIEEDNKSTKKKDNELEQKLVKDPKVKDENKKVKPLLISQNKVLNNESNTTSTINTGKKRALDQVDANSPPRNEGQQASALKKSRPSLMDSKRSTTLNKYENSEEMGEEDYDEETDEEDADVEEEIEEEDIDSVAAEEDENEEKLFEDYDDDEEDNEVGEEISDPVVRVTGEGSGKDCDVGNYLYYFDYDLNDHEENGYDLSEEIVEDVFYVWGEGSGKECLVGNKNNDDGSPTKTATKNDAELLKTNMEAKSETELEKSTPEEENKTTFILSPKKTVPKDDVPSADTTKLAETLEDKTLKPAESSEEKPKENENQVKPTEEKSQINGEDKSKEPGSKTEAIDEKQPNPIETANKLSVSKDNQKQPELKPNIEPPLKDNQMSSKITTISKTDSTKTDAISQQAHASKMSALESLKKELRESKQKILEKKSIASNESSTIKLASPAIYNRKRRLTDQLQTIPTKPPNSESEVDLNSENPEDMANDQELGLEDDDVDVGGKRLKMRPKQTNTELRKKIEAQKVAANDETTSSSGGEEELRRRKKIILSKQTATALKTEEKSATMESIKDNNTANDNQALAKICEKSSNSTINQQQTPIKKPTQITPTKVKPTLAEIIEKKLKKTPEKNDNDTTATTAKTLFPSPNKSPITKPLKKNLLTQIRQEESDEDAVPRKRTNSQDLNSQISSDIKIMETTTTEDSKDSKAIVTKIVTEKPRTTPERQRKRRSSEETVQHDSPEEPEAKKEVTAIAKDKEDSVNRDKPTETIKEEEIVSDSKDVEFKKESSTPVSGRRSGRRSGAAPIYVENLQTKRNRGAGKNSTKKDLNDCDKVEAIKEEEPPSKETKITNSKQDVKEKKIADKAPNDKNKSCSTENVKEEIETKTVQTPTKSETGKQKSSPTTKTPAKGVRKQRDVDTTNIIDVDSETPVRQSRRIAQQKIREEAERRKLEEIALRTMKQELKKKKKAEKQADPTVVPPTEPSSESEDSDVETKKKVQKKKCPGKNGNWSSGSEEQEEPDEEDEEPPHYETDPGSPLFKSDHEFSPESDIEDESQVVPMKRARTVRKEDADEDPEEEEACQKCNKSDHPEWILLCDNCDKGYHCSCLSPVLFYIPEGDWYCPPCQQEQLIKALENQLKEFDDLVENKKKEEEQVKRLAEEEKARQEKEEESKKYKNKKGRKTNAKRNKGNSSAEDQSQDENDDDETSTNSDDSLDSAKKKKSNKTKNKNRSKNSDKRNHRDRRHNAIRSRRSRQHKRGSDSDSDSQNSNKSKSESNSSSSSSTYSESDNEPIYKLRKRRQINVSYRLNEYDDLINSALKKEMDEAAGAGNLGRGKDISTIIEADKEEKARQKEIEDGDEEADVKPKEEEGKVNEVDVKETKEENSIKTEPKETTKEEKKEIINKEDDDDSDAEPIMRKFNIKPSQKKKSRKLTTLDISSEDDNASDEDFKGSSLDDEDEEDTSISASNSDSSLEIYKRHGKSKKKRRKAARRAFRERRKDRRFVVDESDDEDVQRPKSKKKRKDDSDYTESEGDDDISELSENIDSADLCDDTTTDESDGNWRPNKRKKAKKSSNTFAPKIAQPKSTHVKKPKKVEYSDDDVSESEEDEDDDDDNDNIGSGKGMGKQPRSQPLKTTSSSSKTKGKGKEKPPTKTKKKKKSSEDDDVSQSDSEDSTRRTRGRRYAYIEDFDDDSSDGGIKPGVQRPDTPPEEREKFIKRQEEIKRMLAEKNAEGAKLVATPRLTPIKTDADKDKRSPTKTAGGDSLSTVPLSVIRQAKVLDIDYLQRRGENLDDLTADVGDVDDFDDADLPDDLPEDMDEDAIARMVEEEEEFGGAVARDLPTPDEVLKTPTIVKPVKTKDVEKPLLPATVASPFPTNSPHQSTPATLATPTASGLQEPVRKRLPMPTMHPPLLRHQYLMQESMSNTHHLMQRHGGPPTTSHLLQNALSAPLTQPLDRNYPGTPSPSHHSLINRMIHNIPLQPTISQALGTARPPPQSLPPQSSSILAKSSPLLGQPAQDKSTNPQPVTENKPRGRRKKITPLRDTLQKQQTAAAVTAATATNAALTSATAKNSDTMGTAGTSPLPPSVIKSGSPSKLPMQASVITSMPPTSHTVTSRPGVNIPPISGAYVRAEGPRFYDLPGNRMPQVGVPRHRGPPQMPPSLLPPHPANRSSYGPPPPLKGSSSGPSANPTSSSNTPGSIRNPMHHVPPPYLGMPPNARHAPPPHLNMYSRAPMYGNPNFGPRMNLRPPMHAPEYSTGSRAYPPYGFYPPPPPLTTPPGQRSGSGSAPRPPTQIPPISVAQTQPPASVIVSAATAKPTNTPTATPQPTPPPTPEITEHGSSGKPVAIGHDSPIKTAPPKSSSSPKPVVASQTEKSIIAAVPVAEPRKKLTTLQAYTTSTDKKSPVQPTGDSSGSQSSPAPTTEVNDDSSTPGPTDNAPTSEQTSVPDGQASEFSGLVSYFSSQHDDYNT